MKSFIISVAGNPENQDRGCVIHESDRTVLCVADGVGGRSGAAEAAAKVLELVRQNATILESSQSCSELVARMDVEIMRDSSAGETTCALVVATSSEIFGASVGDSEVWLVPDSGERIALTEKQRRKPFVGSGAAFPVPFHSSFAVGVLLLATDGLFKYTSAERIVHACLQSPPGIAAEQLIELVRYKSGAMPDDVTVILAKL